MANSDEYSEDSEINLPGEFLKAWNSCYSDFKGIANLTDNEKDLRNYNIQFQEDSDHFIVRFISRLLSEKMMKMYNKIALGRETKYWIDKNNYKVKKRMFYKS